MADGAFRSLTIQRSDIDRCPKGSLSAKHYRADGTCFCTPDGWLAAAISTAKANVEKTRVAHEAAKVALYRLQERR